MYTTSCPAIYHIYLRPDATGVDRKHKAHICMFILHMKLTSVQLSKDKKYTVIVNVLNKDDFFCLWKIPSTESWSFYGLDHL